MKFVHTNIAARNWQLLAKFYTTVFKCRIKPPERAYTGKWLDQATGLTDARLSGAHLTLPGWGDEGPTLEIFSYEKMASAPEIMANTQGYTHIAFEVDDVRTTFDLALAHGGKALGQVTEKRVPDIGTLVFVYFRDPEGNIVEIQSWDKD